MASSTRSSDLRPLATYSVLRSLASSAPVTLSTLGPMTRPSTAAPSRCLSTRRASCSFLLPLDSRRSTPSASRYFSQMTAAPYACHLQRDRWDAKEIPSALPSNLLAHADVVPLPGGDSVP